MILRKAEFYIEDEVDGVELLRKIERAGRTCYKSEDKITVESSKKFVQRIINMGHESVLEHEKITVRIICDRGVSHEIVRHRIASYSQESTRYCNYSKDKFNNQITFIEPVFWSGPVSSEKFNIWCQAMASAEAAYFRLINLGATAQEARSVLPNSLKTEIVISMNMREWRHFFKVRTALVAHPQMLEITGPLLDKFKELVPVIFDDIIG